MALRPGYKPTEVGIIPDEWTPVRLGGVMLLQRGYDLPHRHRRSGNIPIVSSSGISDTHDSFQASGPGVVTGRYGTIGDVYYIDENYWPLNTTLFVKDFKGNSPLFSSYLLRTIDFKSHSEKSGVPGVNRNDLHEIIVARPPLVEQTAIANALSDADALIQSLQKLIAKKRQIKQGAMQALLNPFENGELKTGWSTKKLGDVADIRSGGTPSTNINKFWNGDVLWCTPTDITALNGNKYISNTNRKITAQGLKNSSAEIIPAYSIVMTTRATIGECAINLVPISTNQGFKNFVAHASTDVDFLYYLLQTKKTEFIGLCSGSTFLEISKYQVFNFEIALPEEKTEQTHIATILSDMDADIAALETKLVKYQKIKQGMMQNLLTGRIRLV